MGTRGPLTSPPQPGEPAGETVHGVEPTVLMVGAGDALLHPLTEALVRHGVFVESTSASDVLQAVIAGAPDLILLVDEAARDRGNEVIGRLATSPFSSVIPVAILDDEAGLQARLEAFRHGVAAIVRRSASVDAIAAEVARLVREIPERTNLGLGDIGEVSFEELVTTLARELRSGILSVRARGAPDEEPVRLVLGGGRPVSAIIDEFVQRMGTHVLSAEPLSYEFDERAGGTIQLFGADSLLPREPDLRVAGIRVLLADDDAGRADAVAQELRRHGAVVAVTDFQPNDQRMARLRELDPMVLVVGEEHVQRAGYDLIQRMRAELRLRWSALLVVNWKEVWPEAVAAPDLERLLSGVHVLGEPERTIRERVARSAQVELRLEAMGPARLLRALAEVGRSVRATVHHPRALVHVDISDGLIVGARAETLDPVAGTVEGAHALSALIVMSAARVRVEHVTQPASANLMSTPDVALSMADHETPPISPSLVPAAASVRTQQLWSGLPAWAPVVALGGLGALCAIVLLGVVLLGGRGHTARPKAAPVRSGQPASIESAAVPAQLPSRPSAAPSASTPAQAARAAGEDPTAKCRELLTRYGPSPVGSELRSANRAMMRGDLEDANRWYCLAAQRYPDDPAAFTGLVRLLLLEGRQLEALHYAQRAVDLKPTSGAHLGLLGDAYALAGDDDAARAAFCQAARIDVHDAAALQALERRYRGLAYSALDEKRYSEGVRFFRRAVALRPQSNEALLGLARALLMDGKREAALEHARKVVERSPKSTSALVMLGDALDRTGDREAALRAWKQAAALGPTDGEARYRLQRAARGK